MQLTKIYAVDSATVSNTLAVMRGDTEIIDFGTSSVNYRAYYVFDNSPLPDGVFAKTTIVIPIESDPNPGAARRFMAMVSRPEIGSTDGSAIWNGGIQAPAWATTPASSGTAFRLNVSSGFESLTRVLTAGLVVVGASHTVGGSNVSPLCYTYTARSDLSVRPHIEYYTYDLTDPPTATIVSPKDTTVNGDMANSFIWEFSQPAGGTQTHVDIQYERGGEWQVIADKVPLTIQEYVIPPPTLRAGKTRWRLRTYSNGGNSASEWDEAEITVSATPTAPLITEATNTPKLTVSWNHDNQQAGYRLCVTPEGMTQPIIDTGMVYTANGFWRSEEYLPDGEYVVSVRTVDAYQVWSEWTTASVSIRNIPAEAITLELEPTGEYGARLAWKTDGNYSQYIILRNGKAIGSAQGATYTDYFSVGAASYVVRGAKGSYYTDSNEKGCRVKVHPGRC